MLKQKLIRTAVLVTIVVAAALAADYVLNVVVLARPDQFTPVTTLLIATLVCTPVAYYLTSQRFDMQRVREALAASLADNQAALGRLRDSEATYRLLADNQTDVISLWTPDGRRKYTSPSIERALGFTVDEIMARPGAGAMHPADNERMTSLFQDLRPADGVKTVEFRLLHKDGSEIWVEGTFQRLGDGSNGLLTTTRLIGERKRLEGELLTALDEANAALAVKSDFLANMTHELRTPLNAIVGFSGLLKGSTELNPRDARQVTLIWDASQTLLRVVNDVLDFSRLDAGAVEFEAHPFKAEAVAQAAIGLIASQAAAKGLRVNLTAPDAAEPLLGDGARLGQVLLNFLSNAVKFTTQGTIEVVVKQTSEGDRRRLRMAVRDRGIGVDADQRDAIFGRFTQGDASVSRQYGGTGLGLAISKRIIDGMGGVIGVDSVVGQGSTFWFEASLPVAEAVGATPTAASAAPAFDQALRLLLVDDNAVNRELICALLAPFSLVVETACDGVEAIEATAREHFDLILMDVQMPVMDGLTATRRIRDAAPAGTRRIPIIAMTANVLTDQIERCLEAGMDDHIGKPINPAQLVQTISRWTAAETPAPAPSRPLIVSDRRAAAS